jgi:lipid-binding SYLF domain-containing protein
MKTTILGLLVAGMATSALALDKSELDGRISKLTAKFEALQLKPDKAIPAEHLRRAHGIVLLDRTKGGLVFAYEGGHGVALVKDAKTEKWSPAAFVETTEASLGFQIGGQRSFTVVLLMSTNATRALVNSKYEFSGEARGTAIDTSDGVESKFTGGLPSVLVYTDREGLYGGAAIKGGAISPDEEANRIYYERFVTMEDILFDRKVQVTEQAATLAAKLAAHAKQLTVK